MKTLFLFAACVLGLSAATAHALSPIQPNQPVGKKNGQVNAKAGQPGNNKKTGQPGNNKKTGQPVNNKKTGQPVNNKTGQPVNKRQNQPRA